MAHKFEIYKDKAGEFRVSSGLFRRFAPRRYGLREAPEDQSQQKLPGIILV